jgi:hypothetical protein
MSPLILTQKQILDDIGIFQQRIRNAQEKLAALPQKANGYKEQKKLKFKRRVLKQEIKHVKGLISIASQALPDDGCNHKGK